MIDLLYVDHERLQSYAEQTGRRSRRVLSYSGSFGLSGPSVGATSTRPELSKIHEQLAAVRKYLTRKKLVSYERPAFRDETPFREETLELQSAYVPPNGNHLLLKNGFSLWISNPSQSHKRGPGLLLLIEQFPLPDEPSVRTLTGYTFLEMLYEEFDLVELPDKFELPVDYKLDSISGIEGKYAVPCDELKIPVTPGIGTDTLQYLKMLNVRVGPLKRATALYRVRTTFIERARNDSVTTIGYPIAIWRE